jgi:hypothetical protein
VIVLVLSWETLLVEMRRRVGGGQRNQVGGHTAGGVIDPQATEPLRFSRAT